MSDHLDWKTERDLLFENEDAELNGFKSLEDGDFSEKEIRDEVELGADGDNYSDPIFDIDFSMFKGSFKKNFKTVKHKLKSKPQKKAMPLSKAWEVKNKQKVNIGGGKKQLGKIIVPRDRDVRIEGVSEFILSDKPEKKIGYYKGEKLKELILTIDNTNGADFTLELFNPSMPLDYLQSTSGNLNDRITVAQSNKVSYSDMLYNMLANPTIIPNARVVFTGANTDQQKNQNLLFTNKALDGETRVAPLTLELNKDIYQVQGDIVLFDIMGQLDRPFIPDGMDVVQYKVLANSSVTFCFYYKQKQIKKLMWPEARKKVLFLDELKELL